MYGSPAAGYSLQVGDDVELEKERRRRRKK
jgi:hypothetical protein